MTRDEMVADLQARIGSDPEVSSTRLVSWIDQGLRAFCMEDDFTWLEKKATANTVANQEEYSLPTDYKRHTEVRVDPTTSSPNIYTYVPHEQRSLYTSANRTFSVFNEKMLLNPIPTASGTNNIHLWYIRKVTNMTQGSDSPSDSDVANMPEEYHEALILYAFAIYNSYDEEHDEKRELMGNPRQPVPGTYYYYVDLAKREDAKRKRGARRKMMSKQEFTGSSHPNETSRTTTVLGN